MDKLVDGNWAVQFHFIMLQNANSYCEKVVQLTIKVSMTIFVANPACPGMLPSFSLFREDVFGITNGANMAMDVSHITLQVSYNIMSSFNMS